MIFDYFDHVFGQYDYQSWTLIDFRNLALKVISEQIFCARAMGQLAGFCLPRPHSRHPV